MNEKYQQVLVFFVHVMLPNMKRLGIDYGSKKIGLAVTDDGGSIAFPLEVVPNDDSFVSHIEQLVADRNIDEIVIGHSLDNQGKANIIHEATEELITNLTLVIGIPVHLEPEQYSTQEAKQIQGQSAQTDASAAAIILNSFIDKQK